MSSLNDELRFPNVQNKLTHTHVHSNSQIWYHRRALLEAHGARAFLEEELNYITDVIDEDSKNYHAWSYRQWILMTVDDEPTWERELEFSTSLSFVCFVSNLLLDVFFLD